MELVVKFDVKDSKNKKRIIFDSGIKDLFIDNEKWKIYDPDKIDKLIKNHIKKNLKINLERVVCVYG
jgi:hypothetical protein